MTRHKQLMIVFGWFHILGSSQFASQILRLVDECWQALGANPGLAARVTQRHQRNLIFRSGAVQALM
jgi:hypothetical protein